MKYKVEDELITEIKALDYLKQQLELYKKMKADVLRGMTPQPLESVDYSKWKVDGGCVKVIEEEINKLIHAQQNIIALEELIKIKSEFLDQKANFIKGVLNDRERKVFERTFLNGETCEYTAFELNCGVRTIQRDRAIIISKMRKIQGEMPKNN